MKLEPNAAYDKLSEKDKLKLFLSPCKTRSQLKKWIKLFTGFDLPDYTVSRFADSNPLDVVWQIYDICVNKNNPEDIEELLFVAARGSGKTLAIAIAEFMIMLHDQRDVVHVGAILSQAKRCYEYQFGFYLNDRVKPLLGMKIKDVPIIDKTNIEKSSFNLIDRYSGNKIKVSLEVLPCTLKAVNGPHVPLVSVDEIDTVQGEGLKAFKDISGMLDSRDSRKALRIGISTRKSRYGLMNQQIENAEEAGRTVKSWTTLEFSQKCPDDRSGKKPTVGYILQDEMLVIDEETWRKKSAKVQSEFEKNDFPGEKCLRCPIAALCRGDAKNQESKSNMLKPISDAIKKAKENGADWTISQLFNLKPSIEGIVYKEFDEKLHVKNWNQMWHILTGKEYPGECTHDDFVKKCHQMKLSAYAGIDWGWSNPSTLVVFFVDNRENVYVVRTEGQIYTNNPTWVQTIKNKWHHMYGVQLYYPDLANPGDAVTMRQEGLPCPTEQTKDTNGGIQIVKKWLRSLASPVPKMYFAEETCSHIIREFTLYHYKTDAAGNITDDPASEYDHWLDALRYALYELFGKNRMMMAIDDSLQSQNVTDRYGNFNRPPTPEEFAKSRGISINTEIDTSKLGKIGTKQELDDDDDGGSAGGFIWSF